jgi:heme-degrading monooxygenase HmoA
MAKVIVQHRVTDYDHWYAVFTEHEQVRRSHGARSHTINRSVADPNTLVVVIDFASAEGAQAFAQDPSLKDAMARAGVDGAPQVWIANESETRTY